MTGRALSRGGPISATPMGCVATEPLSIPAARWRAEGWDTASPVRPIPGTKPRGACSRKRLRAWCIRPWHGRCFPRPMSE